MTEQPPSQEQAQEHKFSQEDVNDYVKDLYLLADKMMGQEILRYKTIGQGLVRYKIIAALIEKGISEKTATIIVDRVEYQHLQKRMPDDINSQQPSSQEQGQERKFSQEDVNNYVEDLYTIANKMMGQGILRYKIIAALKEKGISEKTASTIVDTVEHQRLKMPMPGFHLPELNSQLSSGIFLVVVGVTLTLYFKSYIFLGAAVAGLIRIYRKLFGA